MIIEDFIFPNGTKTKKLTPSDGYKYITDEVNYVPMIILGKGASVDDWHDTNDEPPQPPPDPETQELANVVEDAYTLGTEVIGG